jgi:hypothetical protein
MNTCTFPKAMADNNRGHMNPVRIIYITPLYGSILLLIIENQVINKRDAKLLIDTQGITWPATREAYEAFEVSWPDEIGSGENNVEMSFKIDDVLLGDIQNWYSKAGVTVEQLIIAFMRFCACPQNHDAVRDWLTGGKIGM